MPARSFRAFVSYCHADRAFAAKLQRRLEGYRLPRRLAASLAPLPGQMAGRIGPVFRDRADLSASEDLSAAVREAIAASSALVVVASPDAARSRWVAREIALFRELHPNAPVLTALARGEPAEGLPAALRENDIEPLAADFRREGDGPRLAFLKVVAGIAGLPLDALVQRDAQRRVRRVTAVTLGALAVALMMTAMTGVALVARAQAVRERNQAEGLIEFMLTDLRERLRGVGRLDVMERVNRRAMEYYAAQGDLSHLADDSLLRRARVLHAMGEDDGDLDHRRDAVAKFNEAHRVTAMLLARWPDDPNRIFAHAQSEYWVGEAAWQVNDFAKARGHFEQYAEMTRKLVTIDPTNQAWQMELGYAQSNLGALAKIGENRADLALLAFELAGRHFEAAQRLAPSDPVPLRELADNYGWIADCLFQLERYERAYGERMKERQILDQLAAAEPTNAKYARDLVDSSLGIARVAEMLGRSQEARARLESGRVSIDALARRDPDNKSIARQRASVYLRLAGLAVTAGRPSRRDSAIMETALKACATPGALSGTDEQKRLCETLRTRVSGVSIH